MPFDKLQEGCHVPFTVEWLPSGHYHKDLTSGVLQRWLSFWKVLTSPQRNSGALSVTIGFLVTSLTKALLTRLLSLARLPALGRVLVVPNFFHFKIMEAVFLGTQTFFGTLPQICALTQSCLGALRTIPLTLWLGFCSVGPYLDR